MQFYIWMFTVGTCLGTWNTAEFINTLFFGIPQNSAEFNANSDKSSEIQMQKIPMEFRTDGIP